MYIKSKAAIQGRLANRTRFGMYNLSIQTSIYVSSTICLPKSYLYMYRIASRIKQRMSLAGLGIAASS